MMMRSIIISYLLHCQRPTATMGTAITVLCHQLFIQALLVSMNSLNALFVPILCTLLFIRFPMLIQPFSSGAGNLYTKCHNGHTLCSTCKTRVHNRCPTCRQELGDIRCLALEKVAESLELPCKYMSLGCPEIFPYYSKLKHEALCNFRPYSCPYAGSECAVVGDIPFLVTHLRDDHKVDMHSGCTFNHRYVKSNPQEVENATWMLTVFHCFGQYFCLHFEAFQLGVAPVYMAFLRFMGDEIEARNYSYSLEVGGNGRKLIWEGTPRSIRDSHRKVRDSHDGLIIQRNMALFFSGGDRKELKLRVTGRIWKEQQNPEGGACIPNLCS
ncbi:hypothetical protein J1N35_026081 [Gossypium stocksii]|uniref:RING-type E3 ubiquitin transferase n=2 Tax=Gossypium TaxID=3633 RepID=A0A9D3VA57_9ROSI|nr:hypothetical protein J1N35_026081 [Gossypium stocksii]